MKPVLLVIPSLTRPKLSGVGGRGAALSTPRYGQYFTHAQSKGSLRDGFARSLTQRLGHPDEPQ